MVQKDDDVAVSLKFHYVYPRGDSTTQELKLLGPSETNETNEELYSRAGKCILQVYNDGDKMQMHGETYEIKNFQLKNSLDEQLNLMPALKYAEPPMLQELLNEKVRKLTIGSILPEVVVSYKHAENDSESEDDSASPVSTAVDRQDSDKKRFPAANEPTEGSNEFEKKITSDNEFSYVHLKYLNTDANEGNRKISYNHSEDSEFNYVGLVNQAMTCYLNSLLQALYMTPEFRNALYIWEFKNTEKDTEVNSIPYQLQKLFLNLQTSHRKAVETTSLTKSFGWDVSDSWLQHDIQELCRVMFDALEHKFKSTAQADLINRLYEGKINDYVKCLTCNTEKFREDTFLDIPLPVRPFDNTVAYGSVEEALEAFVKYETLEGNNQYFCEKCNKKSDAHKGLKFTKFPYILTLQLKRFDFDQNTYNRIKLNDKVTFPKVLNLNRFIEPMSNLESPSREEDAGMSMKCDDSSTTDSSTMGDDCVTNDLALSNSNHLINNDQDVDEGVDVSNGMSSSFNSDNHSNEKIRKEYALTKGPYIYDLFSIMIHSGSASGGHYYAYIKDFRTDKWWQFNDQQVTPISQEEIEKSYGGGGTRGCYSGAYRSSTNAYMLMYRQIDHDQNALPMEAKDFPPHIKELLDKMKKEEEQSCIEEQVRCYKINVYKRAPKTGEVDKVDFLMYENLRLSQVLERACSKYFLKENDMDQYRLVSYFPQYDVVDVSFEGKESLQIRDLFASTQINLLLETRSSSEKFEVYPSDPIVTKVFVIDTIDKDLVSCPKYVRAYSKQTVREYKQELRKHFGLDPNVVQLFSQEILPNKLLDDDFIFDSLTSRHAYIVAATESYDMDMKLNFLNSAFYEMYEYLGDVTTFYIDTSDVTRAQLERMNVPTRGVWNQLPRDLRDDKNQENSTNHYNYPSDELVRLGTTNDSYPSISSSADNYQIQLDMLKQNRKSQTDVSGRIGLPDDVEHDDDSPFKVNRRIYSLHDRRRAQLYEKMRDKKELKSDTCVTFTGKSTSKRREEMYNETQTTVQTTDQEENIQFPDCHEETIESEERKKQISQFTEKEVSSLSNKTCESVSKERTEEWVAQETSNSEDSSLSDSDRTLVGDVPEESLLNFDHFPIIVKGSDEDDCETEMVFKVETIRTNLLKVSIDMRTTEEELKKKLEPHLDIPRHFFRIVEHSVISLDDYISQDTSSKLTLSEDQKYSVRLERKLNPDECKVDVYLLDMEMIEPLQKKFTMVLKKQLITREVKEQILAGMKRTGDIDDLPYDKWEFLYMRGDVVEDIILDTHVIRTSEFGIIVQEKQNNLHNTESSLIQVYVMMFNTSKMSLGPPRSITVDRKNFSDQIKEKIDSDIPVDCLEFYPLVVSKKVCYNTIENGQWKKDISPSDVDFKTYLLYRDSTSASKSSTGTPKVFSYASANVRDVRRVNVPMSSNSRKEKALKIRVGST